MRICIDPGHGGCQPGAVYQGIREADLTMPMCLELSHRLERMGHDTTLTRLADVDVSLRERCRISDAFGAELFISLHLNAASSAQARGSEVWVWTGSRSWTPAALIQSALVDACGMADRKVRETQKYFVLRHTKALAMVIEPGFMSNTEELLMLRDAEYQGKIVDAIALGVQKYSASR